MILDRKYFFYYKYNIMARYQITVKMKAFLEISDLLFVFFYNTPQNLDTRIVR